MDIFWICFVPMLIVPVITGILFQSRKGKKVSVLYYPAYTIVISVSYLALLGTIYIIGAIYQPTQVYNMKMLPVLVASFAVYASVIYLFILGVNWRLEVLDDCIRYRNLFRITKEYPYADIRCIIIYGSSKQQRHGKQKMRHYKYKICINGKKIVVENLVCNFQEFLPIFMKNINKNNCELKIIQKK